MSTKIKKVFKTLLSWLIAFPIFIGVCLYFGIIINWFIHWFMETFPVLAQVCFIITLVAAIIESFREAKQKKRINKKDLRTT